MRIDRIYISLTCGDRFAGDRGRQLQDSVDAFAGEAAVKTLKAF
jgi:hypothetical protein